MRQPSAHHDVSGFASSSSSPVMSCSKYALELSCLSRMRVGKKLSNSISWCLMSLHLVFRAHAMDPTGVFHHVTGRVIERGASGVVRIRDRDVLRHLVRVCTRCASSETFTLSFDCLRRTPAELPQRSTIYAGVEPHVRVGGYIKLICYLLPGVRPGYRCRKFTRGRRFAGILTAGTDRTDRPGDGGGGTVTECPRTGAPDDF